MRSQPMSDVTWTDIETRHLARGLARGRAPIGAVEAARSRQDVLTQAVCHEVIPRLLLARRPCSIAAAGPARPDQAQVSHLAGLVLGGGQAESHAYVESLRTAGMPVEALLLDLLTPAARLLGAMWEDDICSFSDVTLGMLCLGHIMRRLDCAAAGDIVPRAAAPSALLVQMPGEQHGFGLAMVVQFFRRAGWNVHQAPAVTHAGLVDLVAARPFGVVGISVACSARLEALEADIRAIRRRSCNRAIGVMVGGPPFVAHPQLAAMVGADATAVDGRQAVLAAAGLL